MPWLCSQGMVPSTPRLLLQTSGDGDREHADEAMRLHDDIWRFDAARRLLAPRLWATDDLAHHLLAQGVRATRAVAKSADSHSEATTCGASMIIETAQPLTLLERCGLAVNGEAQRLPRSRLWRRCRCCFALGQEGRRLLGAQGNDAARGRCRPAQSDCRAWLTIVPLAAVSAVRGSRAPRTCTAKARAILADGP